MYGELKVLVIEDTEAHQQLITRMLTRLGVEQIKMVSSAAEFLDTIEQKGGDYNSFIVDVYLGAGQMDGLRALEIARERGYDQPALVVTMDTTGIDTKHCYEIGVTELLDKDKMYEDGVFEKSIRSLNDRAVHRYVSRSQATLVPVIGEDILHIPAGDILYIHFDERSSKIVTMLEEYTSTVSLKTYAKLLESLGFALVNKPTLVNMSRVEKLDVFEQTLSFSHDPQRRSVDISARRFQDVKRLLKND